MRPRPYLSYSQMTLLEKGTDCYIKHYLEEENSEHRGYLFGKQVADSLETGELSGDITVDLLIRTLPRLDIFDKEIEIDWEVPLLIKPDEISKDYKKIIEVKTGPEKAWNQRKADSNDQLTFYYTGIYLLKGFIPEGVLRHLKNDKDISGEIHLTGEWEDYKTTRDLRELLVMMNRMKKAWKEIEKITNNYLL